MEMSAKLMADASSFRDPSGVVFFKEGRLLRQINPCYAQQYRALMDGGLYTELTENGLLVKHKETTDAGIASEAILVIEPERIPFISYPYEWSFGMLRDAALLTLRCHRKALEKNMILKDASAYNVQFLHGNPILIDTLSFDFYRENTPWIAYGQFCRHFLAPLLMMRNIDLQMNKLLRLYIDGIPMELASKLLKGKGGFFAKQHIHWHAKAAAKHASDGRQSSTACKVTLPQNGQIAIIDSLIHGIESLQLGKEETEWGDYYANTNYSGIASDAKAELVEKFLRNTNARNVWDLGANDGSYSRLALCGNTMVVAFDIDPLAVERNYTQIKADRSDMLPLIMDLTNPSPSIGFANRERVDMASRQKPDCIMALAIIHHLAISNNLPLDRIAEWMSELAQNLIIEFVPKEDSQVQILLATREDIFPQYSISGFEAAFMRYFTIEEKEDVSDSRRILYRMRRI